MILGRELSLAFGFSPLRHLCHLRSRLLRLRSSQYHPLHQMSPASAFGFLQEDIKCNLSYMYVSVTLLGIHLIVTMAQ